MQFKETGITKRPTNTAKLTGDYKKALELQRWFDTEYVRELMLIEMSEYLGFEYNSSKRALMLLAYSKEQELRKIKGETLLKPYNYSDMI